MKKAKNITKPKIAQKLPKLDEIKKVPGSRALAKEFLEKGEVSLKNLHLDE